MGCKDCNKLAETTAYEAAFVSENGKVYLRVRSRRAGLTTHEIARDVIQVVARILADHSRNVLTQDEEEERERLRKVEQDYPGVRYYEQSDLVLCVACWDLYGPFLSEQGVKVPSGFVRACDYHLGSAQPPVPVEEAIAKDEE